MSRGEGIKTLTSLFEKYKKILKAPQGVVIDCFIEVVQELMQILIPKEKVSYSVFNKTLSVRVSGPLKSEIIFRKKEIIAHLKGRLGEQGAPQEIL